MAAPAGGRSGEGHVVDDDSGLAEFFQVFAEEFITRVGIAGNDGDGFAGQADHALTYGLKYSRIGVGAMEDGHLPAPGTAEVEDVLVDEHAVAGEVRGVGERERVIALPAVAAVGTAGGSKCSARLPPAAGSPSGRDIRSAEGRLSRWLPIKAGAMLPVGTPKGSSAPRG